MSRTRTRTSWVAACGAALVLTACGTTVPDADRQVLSGGLGGQGLEGTGAGSTTVPGDSGTALDGGPALPGESSGSGTAAGAGGPGGAGAPSGSGSGQVAGSAAGPGTASAAGPAAVTGRGFTEKTVKIGVATAEDASAFASNFGIEGVSTGDTRGQIDAVIAEINRQGGLAGRQVVPVVHDFNTAELAGNPAAAMQAACATWTQDDPVYVVANPPLIEGTLLECLKRAQTPLVYSALDFPRTYSDRYAKYPGFFNINSMLGERYDAVAVDRLVARGYFSRWDFTTGAPGAMPVKVGLMVTDDEPGRALTRSMSRQLAEHGLGFAVTVTCPTDLNRALACRQAAGLRFRNEGITHVFGASLPFMQQSESQGYRPRYFLEFQPNTYAQNAPPAQLSGAMAQSYIPALDVAQAQDPGPPTAASTRCVEVMRKGGQQADQRSVLYYFHAVCDGLFFIKAAVDRQGRLGDGILPAGLESLGSSTPAALTWKTALGPGEHAGVRALRDLEFRRDCRCFVYPTPTDHTG